MNRVYDPLMDPADGKFCSGLELALCRYFRNSDDVNLKGLWCDGIISPGEPPHSGLEIIQGHLALQTRGWCGLRGQDEFTIGILLGEKTKDLYFKGVRMDHLVPTEDVVDWVDIDLDRKTLFVRLP